MAEQKPQFRDELENFSKKNGTPLNRLNDGQRSDTLVLGYLLLVRNALLPGSVPEEQDELRAHICDNAGDRFVDFIYRDDNGHVTIVQSKFRGKDKSEDESHFDSFRKCLEKLCPQTRGSTSLNQAVLDQIADVDWENDTFTLLFLSLARNSKTIADIAERGLDDVPNSPLSDVSSRAEIRYLSEEEINKDWRDVLGQARGEPLEVKVMLTSPGGASQTDYLEVVGYQGVRSFICVLSAGQIHQLYTRYRDRLFNLNIRNYIGDTRTNKGIMETAKSEAARFFLYNNGISAVCSKIVVRTETDHTYLICKEFSIINGAQTLRSISKAYTRPGGTETKKLTVMLRVSEIDYRQRQAAEVLDNITKFNNTQNSMKVSDFRSNDAVQSSLVKYISQVPASGGKPFLYRNKRTQAVDRNKSIIKMDDFCRSVFAFVHGPADFFGGLSFLYDTGPEGGYTRLFGKDLGALSQDKFDYYFGAWLLTSYAGERLKSEKSREYGDEDTEKVRKLALERKHLVFFSLGEVFREIAKLKKVEAADFISSFSKPRWLDETPKKRTVQEAFEIACDITVQAYQMAVARQVIHRNFFRDSETLTSIRNSLISRKSQISRLSMTPDKVR